jgi:hypothetical protein
MLPFCDRRVTVARKDIVPVWTRSFPISIKNPPIRRRLAILYPRGVQPLRQSIARDRMLVFTKPEKFSGPNLAG